MKGLLIKDLRTLMAQKRFFVIIIVFGLLFLLNSDTPEGAMAYITIISSMLVITTMSYDEFEKGMSYIMTLPITPSMYVWGKYLLGIVLCFVMSGLTALFAIFVYKMRGIPHSTVSFFHSELAIFGFALLFLAVMIPVQLKFGVEKGNYVKFIAMGAVIGACAGTIKLLSMVGIDVMGMLERLLNISVFLGFAAVVAFCVILYLVSALISLRIMGNKEF